MNDRYLYRAVRTDNGEWIVGSLIQTSYLGSIRSWISSEQEDKVRLREISSNQAVWRAFEVRTDTICQCTGLRDKNGKLIWENDILRFTDEININGSRSHVSKVEWNVDIGGFVFHADCIGFYSINPAQIKMYDVEVIGSAIDNPELLEVE